MSFEWAKDRMISTREGMTFGMGFEGWVELQLGGLDFRNSLAPGESGVKAAWREPGLPCPIREVLFSKGGFAEEACLPHSACSRDLAEP